MAVAHLDLAADSQAAGSRVSRPDIALYFLWGMFWLLMIGIAVQDYARDGGKQWWQPMLWEGSSLLVATFWLVLQRRADRRYAAYLDQPLRWFGHHLKWLPLIVVTFIASVYAIRHGVYALLGETYKHESWSFVLVYESIKLVLFFGLWLGLIFGFDSFAQAQEQRQRLLALQKSLAEAQLAQLKAQLRPHFFFNALNTISALMHVDVPRADRLLARLGDLLRSDAAMERPGNHVAARGNPHAGAVRADHAGALRRSRLADLERRQRRARTARFPPCSCSLCWRTPSSTASSAAAMPSRIEIEARRDGDRMHIAVRNTGSRPGRGSSRRRWAAQLPRATERALRRRRAVAAEAACRRSRGFGDAALAGASRMMRVLVADDEAPARDKLQRWLSEQADIEVVARIRRRPAAPPRRSSD